MLFTEELLGIWLDDLEIWRCSQEYAFIQIPNHRVRPIKFNTIFLAENLLNTFTSSRSVIMILNLFILSGS